MISNKEKPAKREYSLAGKYDCLTTLTDWSQFTEHAPDDVRRSISLPKPPPPPPPDFSSGTHLWTIVVSESADGDLGNEENAESNGILSERGEKNTDQWTAWKNDHGDPNTWLKGDDY